MNRRLFERRAFLGALLGTPAIIAVLQACGSDRRTSSTTTAVTRDTVPASSEPVAAAEARSDKGRLAATPSDLQQSVTVVNDFGVDMYHRLAESGQANLVFSPASIAIALAMTRVGAKGSTATEMDRVLHARDANTLSHSMNALSSTVARSEDVEIEGVSDKAHIEVDVANSLWGPAGLHFESEFLDTLASEFGAGLRLVDYRADPEAARGEINAWVDEATQDRIPELLAHGTVTGATRLTLVNAIYMKAPWEVPFKPSATKPGTFTTANGATVEVPMMASFAHMSYASTSVWHAVSLPYKGGSLSMLVLVPLDDGFTLDGLVDALSGIEPQFGSQLVHLTLPTFDIETATGLAGLLTAMGMPTAFDKDAADFSGMTTDQRLFISDVVHQANITVDEEGTEAAAATAVVMEAGAAPVPQEPVEFTVDRPFVFAVRDNESGAILFLGHVGDPS